MDRRIASATVDYLFTTAATNSQARMDSLGAQALGQGIDHFQAERYDQAIISFRKAAALSPSTGNAASAFDYMGQAYLKQEKTDQAIKTYQEAIRLFPSDETFHRALGDIYIQEEKTEEAIQQYEQAVKLNVNDAESSYSLGQAYLKTGELDKARQQFNNVARISPASATGYYGLGQVARTEGDTQTAIDLLTKSISVNKDFEIAYVELGSAYADAGDFQKADEMLSYLEYKNSSKTIELRSYITNAHAPRIMMAQANDGFNTAFGPKTQVSSLSSKLEDPGSSKLFSMNFAFSKDMDEASITNTRNWTISRANLSENRGIYNNGLPISAKEEMLSLRPAYVTYNKDNNMATVYFSVDQNATADATIDPKHIVFKFSGLDAYGKAMDASADEYAGFSGVA
ncbi:MAG TPA: tetratricopeptide repeat protein [Smithellaceae bacterium]|nr:tetratricopeptide repeat protein [Smithellaceae bacterium]